MKNILKIVLFLSFVTLLNAKNLHKESYYQKIACDKLDGVIEYRLKNKTRVDCLTDDYAIEVDFAKKGYEAIGQSLYYALKTDKKAGVIIIRESKKDDKYIGIVKEVAKKHNITMWIIAKKFWRLKLVKIVD